MSTIMKKALLFIIALAAFSCSKEQSAEELMSSSIETKSLDNFALTSKDTLFTFDKITEPSNWRTYESFDEMVKACQIPETLLDSLSTEALYKLCVEYPLGPSCFLFNDSNFGLDKMLETFNGYAELQRRLSSKDGSYNSLKKFSTQFDNVIAKKSTDLAPLEAKYKQLLDEKIFGVSKYALNTKTVASLLSTNITVRTPYGKPVDAITGWGDLTEDEYNYMNAYLNTYYPNAIILGDATKNYNCHGYAWCMTTGGPTCWINCGTSPSDLSNLSKYWTNDAYGLTSTDYASVKIHYYNGDHSAVKSTVPGYYESKWGAWYLIRHTPNYCPYGSDKHYYTGAHYMIQCIQGQDMNIPLGVTRGYYLNPYPVGPNPTWTWDVESGKTGESVVGQFATITQNVYAGTPSVNITITKAGDYDIICTFSNAYITSEWRYQVFVDPA